MDLTLVTLAILGMGAVTLFSRLLPFAVLGKLPLPPLAIAWMRYLPIAILSAVVMPSLLLSSSEPVAGVLTLPVLAALPTAVVGFMTRNLLVSTLVGVSSLALLRTTF